MLLSTIVPAQSSGKGQIWAPLVSSMRSYYNNSRPLISNPSGPLGFVFDIDGVLLRGKSVLQPALQAMKELCPKGEWRFPVCFLTNGGGVSEAHKAQQLSRWLDVPVSEQQVILSHTPMRSLASRLGQQPVLVVGRGDVLAVAGSYSFSKVLSTAQLAAALPPGALPFRKGIPQTAADAVCPIRDLGWCSEEQPLAAVLVMSDPAGTDWYQDLQLLTDVITSHGVPMRQQPLPGSKPVELYFSNPDLLWATDYVRPRFGQGAFSSALAALHRQLTGSPLPNAQWFGKPNPEPYRLAEQLLVQQAVQMGLVSKKDVPVAVAHHSSGSSVADGQPSAATSDTPTSQHFIVQAATPLEQQSSSSSSSVFSAIFAVGDNPASDIRGANQAGAPWVSVLVRSGVFQGPGPNSEGDPAHVVVSDVLAAVHAGLHIARSLKWHSMR